MVNSPFDSNEELLINEWCKFLKEKNYINDYEKNIDDILILTPKKEYCLNIKNKTKCSFLLHPLTYRYDFKIIWNSIAKNVLYNNLDDNLYTKNCYFKASDNISYIDVKGTFTRKNRVTDITFPLIQKILFHYQDKYIQKIVPTILFSKTFATDMYLLTTNVYKVGSKKGTNKHNFKTFNDFLHDCN